MAIRKRPSVTVRQVVQTTTSTEVEPILPSVVVGPCKQVVDPQITSSTGELVLDATARVQLPAVLRAADATGDPLVYALVKDATLCFSVNEKGKVTWTVPKTADYSSAAVVNALKKALADAGETDAYAQKIGSGSGTGWRLLTVAKGDSQSLKLDPDGAATAARITGTVDLTGLTFPDDVTGLTIKVSVQGGTEQTITIASPANAAALAAAIAALTGATAGVDSDNFLYIETDAAGAGQYLEVTGGTLLSVVGITAGIVSGEGSSASLLSTFGFSSTSYAQGSVQYENRGVVIPPASYPDPRNNLDQIVIETDTVRAFLNPANAVLREQLKTSAPLRKGGTVSVVDDGDGDNKSPIIQMSGQNFLNPTPGSAILTGAGAPSFGSLSGKTVIIGDGRAPRVVEIGTVTNIAGVVAAFQAYFDPTDGLSFADSSGSLEITCTRKRDDLGVTSKGNDSAIIIYGGTAFDGTTNYLDTGGTPVLKPGVTEGNPHKVLPGDAVYVDGVFKGNVLRVAPSGTTTRLRLDRELELSFTGMVFSIIANGLDGTDSSRPQAALLVKADGTAIVKHGLIRDDSGSIAGSVVGSDTLIPSKANIYLGYTALRLDVSSKTRGLTKLATPEQVEALLSPIDERNPLGLAAYMMLRAAGRFPIYALGVDAVSEEDPMGTPAAYGRAATHLEGFPVYAIGLLSGSLEVGDIFQSHVDALSVPDKKRERLTIFAPNEPTEKLNTLVASGASGNTQGATSPFELFDTGISDLERLLKEAGIEDPSAITPAEGVFLDIDGDTNRYCIASVEGSVLTLSITFSPGENDDDYFSSALVTDTLVDVAFGVRVRGTAIVNDDGETDLDALAETMAAIASSYSDRRVWVVGPDEGTYTVNSVEKVLPNGYACAIIAAMVGALPVSQSFTNLPMPVITNIRKTSGRFTEDQLDIMAGGGVYLLIKDSATSPVIAREAITSDTTSDETAMDIQLKEVDLLAKMLRISIQPKLGVQNITKATIDEISSIIEGVRHTLVVDKQLLEEFTLSKIGLSSSSNSRLALEGTVKAHYALLGVDFTLFI